MSVAQRLAIATVGLVVICAAAAPLIAPHEPTQVDLAATFRPPFWLDDGSAAHLLGTDQLGRDVLSRIIWGARASLLVALGSVALGGTVGTVVGLMAGYFGGVADAVTMRLTDASLAFPVILLALAAAVLFDPQLWVVMGLIALTSWATYARQARAETLSIKQRDYVALARVAAVSTPRILLRHVLPNVASSLIVLVTFQIGFVIMLESSLSFLGVGIPPPSPSWGNMVSDGQDQLESAWWVSVFPGVAILLVVVCLNVLGDGLRDRLDPGFQRP